MRHLFDFKCHVYECWQENPESLGILFYSLKPTKDKIYSKSLSSIKIEDVFNL